MLKILKILKIDFVLYQLTKIFLLFSDYKKAIFLGKLSISINKKIIYVKLLALIYGQNRNLKMFINTYENLIQNYQLSKTEKMASLFFAEVGRTSVDGTSIFFLLYLPPIIFIIDKI